MKERMTRAEKAAHERRIAETTSRYPDDWIKVGTWDIRGANFEPIGTLDDLFTWVIDGSGWPGDTRRERLEFFLTLPSSVPMPRKLRAEVEAYLHPSPSSGVSQAINALQRPGSARWLGSLLLEYGFGGRELLLQCPNFGIGQRLLLPGASPLIVIDI